MVAHHSFAVHRARSQEFLNNCDQQPKLRELVAHLPPVHNKVIIIFV
jgi:hypothetical protein